MVKYSKWFSIIRKKFDYAERFWYNRGYVEYKQREFFIGPDNNIKVKHSSKRNHIDYRVSCGLIMFSTSKGCGFLNKDGKTVIYGQYEDADRFYCGLSRVYNKNLWGIINLEGKYVIKPTLDYISRYSEGLAYFKEKDLIGYIDVDGDVKIPPNYVQASRFYDGRAQVLRPNTKCHVFIDTNGDMVFNTRTLGDVGRFQEDLAPFQNGEKSGYIDRFGQIKFEVKFKKIYHYSEGRARVQTEHGLYGFIDNMGNIIVEPKFGDAMDFNEGLAPVRYTGSWGYIDKFGNFIVEPQFTTASVVCSGRAAVGEYEGFGYIGFM